MEAHPHDHEHEHEHDHDHPHDHEHDYGHDHDHGHEHEHSGEHAHGRAHTHGQGDEPDRVALTHIGLDIGTATTKLLAWRAVLVSHGHGHEDLRVAQRQILFRSPVLPTPYAETRKVNVAALRDLLPQLWKKAPVTLDAADTRLALLTGPAADHPREVRFALGETGFESIVAGQHLAATLAAYGADAVARSVDPHGEPRTIVNVDIGAGMSRLALCRGGEILETAIIRAGPRLLTLDAAGKLESFDPALGPVAEAAGVTLELGTEFAAEEQKALAAELAESLLNLIERRPIRPLTQQLLVGDPPVWPDRPNGVSFSGRAATYVYGSHAVQRPSPTEGPEVAGRDRSATLGDLGPALGQAIRQRLNRLGFGVQEPEHLATATIIGSAHYRLEDVHGPPILTEPPAFAAAHKLDALVAAKVNRGAGF